MTAPIGKPAPRLAVAEILLASAPDLLVVSKTLSRCASASRRKAELCDQVRELEGKIREIEAEIAEMEKELEVPLARVSEAITKASSQ